MPSWTKVSISWIKSTSSRSSSSSLAPSTIKRHSPLRGFLQEMRLTQKYCHEYIPRRSWLIHEPGRQDDPHRQPTYSLRLSSLDEATHKRSESQDRPLFLGKGLLLPLFARQKSIKNEVEGLGPLAIKPVIPALGPGTATTGISRSIAALTKS